MSITEYDPVGWGAREYSEAAQREQLLEDAQGTVIQPQGDKNIIHTGTSIEIIPEANSNKTLKDRMPQNLYWVG